jgi:O-acetylhomoserine (thiol)-lyase
MQKNWRNIEWVNYPGLPENRFNNRAVKLFGNLGGGLLTFSLGNKQKAYKFIDSLKLARNAANLGDAKTLVIHPASTIFHEFSAEQQQGMEISEDMIRVSVGIEYFEDIKADFKQAIEKTFED